MEEPINAARTAQRADGRLDTSITGQLRHLSEMDHFEIADGEPDIVGWDVRAVSGDQIGQVEDLLVDSATLRVRYLELKLEKDLASSDASRYALLPIGTARFDEAKKHVLVSLESERLRALPAYERGTLDRAYEQSIVDSFPPSEGGVASTGADRDFYDDARFDDRRAFETRRALGTPAEEY